MDNKSKKKRRFRTKITCPVKQYSNGNHCFHFQRYSNGDKAVWWFTLSANQGHIGAKHMLGRCYEDGVGVEKNIFEAEKWYTEASSEGYEKSKKKLEELSVLVLPKAYYEKGVKEVFNNDYKSAFKSFLTSAQNKFAKAQNMVGMCYEYGKGIDLYFSKAVEWYQKASGSIVEAKMKIDSIQVKNSNDNNNNNNNQNKKRKLE